MSKNQSKNSSTDPAQNRNEEKRNEETRKSFENSAATDPRTRYEPVKESKEDEKDSNDSTRKENEQEHGQEGSRETHLARLRSAMRMIEEEIRHIELRSENIK